MSAVFRGALVRGGADLDHAVVEIGDDGRVASLRADAQADGVAPRRVILPGFANAHSHAGMAVLRGLGDGLPTLEWLDVLMAAESELSRDDLRWSMQLALADMIRNGTTAVADPFFWTEDLVDAALESGLRLAIAPGVFGREGRYYEAAGGGGFDDQIATVERLADVYRDESRVRVFYGAHAIYTCGPDGFETVARRSAETGIPVQVHLSENAEEVKEAVEAYGETPVRTAYRTGLLTASTLVSHAVTVTDADIALLAESGASVVHCPRSNLKMGCGIAPLIALRDAGIRLCLGTDGPASNDALDPLQEMRLAMSLQRAALERADALGVADVVPMLTGAGYAAMGFEPTILEAGEAADLVVLDASGVNAEPYHSAASFVGWSATGSDVTDVVVAGRPLLRDGELLTLDEDRIRYEVRRIASRIR